MDKSCILPLPKKGDLTKNYRIITLTSIAAKVYDDLHLNRIKCEYEKFFGKIGTIFGKIDSQHDIFRQFVESLNEFVQKISKQHYYSSISPRHLVS